MLSMVMPVVYRYEELSPSQRKQLLVFLDGFGNPTVTGHLSELAQVFGGRPLTYGRTHWSLWEEAAPVATLGAVTECWEEKGEVYLAYLYADEGRAPLLDRLLQTALPSLAPWTPCKLKLMANAFVTGLSTWAESMGFVSEDRLLEMVLEATSAAVPSSITWCTVTPERSEDFRRVHNAAFQASPNGRLLDEPAMQGMLTDYATKPELLQLGLVDGTPALSLSLLLDPGGEGVVDGLGVHPSFQGRGLGRQGLQHAIQTLKVRGAQRITLAVIDRNEPAVSLYCSEGFRVSRELSTTFVRNLQEVQVHELR